MNTLKFDKDKFKTLLHYIIDKCRGKSNLEQIKIYSYFADFNFYELYEKPITNETYKKHPQGPVPSHFHDVKNELIKEKAISLDRKQSLKKPNISVLSTKELNVINDVIGKLSSMTPSQISEYSHGDMPWRATKILIMNLYFIETQSTV